MGKPDYQKMIEWLSLILRCPICGNKYTAERTDVIESNQQERAGSASTMLVHTDCDRCASSVVFSISMDGPEIFSVGMVTDLTSRDAKRFHFSPEVSVDDVIELHDFLLNFDGDFRKAITSRQ